MLETGESIVSTTWRAHQDKKPLKKRCEKIFGLWRRWIGKSV